MRSKPRAKAFGPGAPDRNWPGGIVGAMTNASKSKPSDAVAPRMAAIVGPNHVLTGADMAAFLVEERGLYHGASPCVVQPGSTAEIAAILTEASAQGWKIVPQGGNTGLVGGQIPSPAGDEIVLSLRRMTRVREIDVAANAMTVEAGVTLLRAQQTADGVDRLFPLSLAAEGSATMGGVLSTNAGGTAVLAYGGARDLVLGLEVVLADGRVMSTLSKLRKDNTGYDLKHLFMGAEGTLGVIAAATLKLFPKPRARATAFVATPSPQAALALLTCAQTHVGGDLKTFELMPRVGLEFVVRHAAGARDPFGAPHPWYVLMEIASTQPAPLEAVLEAILAEAMENGWASDAALAASLDQRAAFWRLRENMSEMQKHEGGSIKHDISVPVSSVPAFLAKADAAVARLAPGVRIVAFGHLGDGNIHYNLSQPEGPDKTGPAKAAFLALWPQANALVHALAREFGGSISAEHGIGALKRDLLPGVKDQTALAVMRAIKAALDPKTILNPGKVL